MNLEDLLTRWGDDPELFVEEALGASPTEQQRDALRRLCVLVRAKIKRKAGKRLTEEEEAVVDKTGISIMSGKGTGKDAFTAWVILWFLICFPRPKIPCTAPTQHQLSDVLWAEIHKWMIHSRTHHKEIESGFDIEEWIVWTAEKVYFRELKGKQWFAIARTTNVKASAEQQAEALQGFHEDYMLVVCDEASGLPDPVFVPLETTLTGFCNIVFLIFNPTRSTGFAIRSQYEHRSDWISLRWNAEDSEIVPKEQIAKLARKYGRDSNYFRISVLGLPPKADPDTLIPWDWVMSCVRGRCEEELVPDDADPLMMSVDVARQGDDKSVVMFARGNYVLDGIRTFSGLDTEQLANWCMGAITEEEPIACMVDAIGIGAGVFDKLNHRVDLCQVIDVIVSELPANEDKFHRLRDELWWRVRELFEQRRISIPDDDELIGELTTIKWEPNDQGQVCVETKKKLKGRGLLSPNKADALCMMQYFSPQTRKALRRVRRRPSSYGAADSWRTA